MCILLVQESVDNLADIALAVKAGLYRKLGLSDIGADRLHDILKRNPAHTAADKHRKHRHDIGMDGKAYQPSTGKEVTLIEASEDPEKVQHYLDAANFSVWYDENGKMMSDPSVGHDYHLTRDNVLTIDCRGQKTGITDVAQFVDNEYSEYGKVLYAYFLRTDGSLWCYSSETNDFSEITFEVPEAIAGDVNLDGSVGVADAVLLQKYLLGKTALTAAQAENAELCKDGSINGFDLAALKRMLLSS